MEIHAEMVVHVFLSSKHFLVFVMLVTQEHNAKMVSSGGCIIAFQLHSNSTKQH